MAAISVVMACRDMTKENAGSGSQATKSVVAVAKEVIAGKWGNGEDRKNRLTAAGYDYKAVQDQVNALLKGTTAATKSVAAVAKEVIAGKWGNGEDRKNRLTAAGYDYKAVQDQVNALLKGTTAAKKRGSSSQGSNCREMGKR